MTEFNTPDPQFDEKLRDVLWEIAAGPVRLEQMSRALKTIVQAMFNGRTEVFQQATRLAGMEPERQSELANDLRLAARMLQVLGDAIDLPEWNGWQSSKREMTEHMIDPHDLLPPDADQPI